MATNDHGLRPGDKVQVRTRFDGGWAGGYEIAGLNGDGGEAEAQVRRLCDQSVLPVTMPLSQIRPEP